MNTNQRRLALGLAVAGALALLGGCETMHRMTGSDAKAGGGTQQVTLSGRNEVPPVTTEASGSGTVTVKADRSVDVRITVQGMTPTAAHIHTGAAGANGPVAVPLTKSGDSAFTAAPGAKFTEAQFESYKAGNTYLNVHSAKHPGGEIRAQLKGN